MTSRFPPRNLSSRGRVAIGVRTIYGAVALSASWVIACGGDEPGAGSGAGGDAGGGGGGAASSGGEQAAGGSAGQPACPEPQPPFGANAARGDSFPDLEVAFCSGERVTLDRFRCDSTVTLYSIGAGWCEPCKEETPLLQEIHTTMAAEGVTVVQIMFQDALSMPATTLFCEAWVEDAGNNWPTDFELTLPVTIDPAGNSLEYFDVAVTPLNVLVGRDGKVLWAETGKIPVDLSDTIRAFL